jgi:hypothetical protein
MCSTGCSCQAGAPTPGAQPAQFKAQEGKAVATSPQHCRPQPSLLAAPSRLGCLWHEMLEDLCLAQEEVEARTLHVTLQQHEDVRA